jgi:hypothetical protein
MVLSSLISKNEAVRAVQAIATGLAFVLPLLWLGVCQLNSYGIMIFIGLPTLMGHTIGWIDSYHDVNWKRSAYVSLLAVLVIGLVLFAIAFEGALCLRMALPI